MLFDTWGNQIQTLCLLPLMSGDTMLGEMVKNICFNNARDYFAIELN